MMSLIKCVSSDISNSKKASFMSESDAKVGGGFEYIQGNVLADVKWWQFIEVFLVVVMFEVEVGYYCFHDL